MILQTIIWTAPNLLTLDVTVPNTINTREFRPVSYLARNSKFHHSILWLTLAITNLYQLVFIFLCVPTQQYKLLVLNTHQPIIVALAQVSRILGKKQRFYTCIYFSVPSNKMLLRKNTQKNHHTIIQQKQQST